MKIAVHSDQPREEWRPGVETRMHVSALNGATQLCIFEQWVAPGAGAPTHTHLVEEVLTVIAGEADMWIDERACRALSADSPSLFPPAAGMASATSGQQRCICRPCSPSPILEATFDGSSEPVRRWLPPD